MIKVSVKPIDFSCSFAQCPPGLFWFKNIICVKTEYTHDNGMSEVYTLTGEDFSDMVEPDSVVVPCGVFIDEVYT